MPQTPPNKLLPYFCPILVLVPVPDNTLTPRPGRPAMIHTDLLTEVWTDRDNVGWGVSLMTKRVSDHIQTTCCGTAAELSDSQSFLITPATAPKVQAMASQIRAHESWHEEQR